MNTKFNVSNPLFTLCFLVLTTLGYGQTKETMKSSDNLKTYVIERDIANVGTTSMSDLVAISQKSCSVLDEMGPEKIQWLHSYVAEDKIYCVYKAESKEALKEHAEKGGFPANSIMEVSNVISPDTAKQKPN